MRRFLTKSGAEGGRGLRVKVGGGGLRLKWAVCSGVESSSGRGHLGQFVAHEMVREH